MTYKSIDFGTIQLVQSSIQKTAQNHWTPSWTHIRLPLARPKSQAFILRASPTSSASCCFRCPATWEVRRDDHFSWDDGSPFFFVGEFLLNTLQHLELCLLNRLNCCRV